MQRPFRWLIATAGVTLVFALLPAAALAAPPPEIEWTSAWNLTPNDATLGAGIDTNGLYTGYEFQIDTNASYDFTQPNCPFSLPGFAECESIRVGEPLPPGLVEPSPEYLPAGSGQQSVHLDLANVGVTLQPGTTYHYRVIAANGGQIVEGPDQTFTTPPARTAPTAPVISSLSISHLTPTDATLEATINTEGQSTLYEFQLWTSCGLQGLVCQWIQVFPLPGGLLLPSYQGQSVSLDLNRVDVTLRPGIVYGYSVKAVSGEGATEAPSREFEVPGEPVVQPLQRSVTPGPVSNEPEVPLAGGQQPAAGGSNSQAPTGGLTSTAGVSAKPAHGKPSTKHGKRRKHKHHDTKAAKHLAKGKKLKR